MSPVQARHGASFLRPLQRLCRPAPDDDLRRGASLSVSILQWWSGALAFA